MYINLCLGAYVPLTLDGNIVVDGILASCYASLNHDLSHISFKPMRWFPNIFQKIFGEDDGSPAFMKTAKEIKKRLTPYQQLPQY